jgi:16S rRNA (guanine527-N7)-methyltransferase
MRDDSPQAAAAKLGLPLSEETQQRLDRYLDLLLETNKQFNLTAITDREVAASRLIAESLAVLPLIPKRAVRLIDIGTGGGVPGMVLAIMRPDLRVDLLDSTKKKVTFLTEAAGTLELSNVRAFHGRAEEFGREPGFRDAYDVAVARAVARLATLSELVLPFVHTGGIAILPKGEAVHDEVAEAEGALSELKGQLLPIHQSEVNDVRFVVLRKQGRTPKLYPRKSGIPSKQPIGVPAA